jgi:hypothetical protein
MEYQSRFSSEESQKAYQLNAYGTSRLSREERVRISLPSRIELKGHCMDSE